MNKNGKGTDKVQKVVVIGCLEETFDTLNCLYHLGSKVDMVITLSKDKAVKEGVTNWADMSGFCNSKGIPIHYVNTYSMKGQSDQELIQSLSPDILLIIGWQRLIPEAIVNMILSGVIGFHGSANFLPWGRGRSPINWSIIEGKNRFILHMFFITSGVDDGDIIGFEIYDINPEDTCRSIYYKTALAQAALLHRFLPAIKMGECPRYPQIGEAHYYSKRTPDDGRVLWNDTAEQICRLVRAITFPYPGAFTYFRGEKVFIWRCQNFGDNLITGNAKHGEVVFVASNALREFVVRCGDGAILVTDYEPKIDIKVGYILEI